MEEHGARAVRAVENVAPSEEAPYWVFVSNPKKWAIDRFLDREIEHDSWGIRPSDRHRFAPGQLGIVRVGVDRRSAAERDGKAPGTGAGDQFWTPGQERGPGWPTVQIPDEALPPAVVHA